MAQPPIDLKALQTGSFMGLPTVSRPEFKAQKKKQRLNEFGATVDKMSAGLPQSDRQVFSMFANVGQQLADKVSTDVDALSPDEERSFSIMEGVNEKFRKLKTTPEFQKLEPVQQSYEFQRLIAEESAAQGDHESYFQITDDLYQRKLLAKKAGIELRGLEAETAGKEAELPVTKATAEASLNRLANGDATQMVRLGPDGRPQLDSMIQVQMMPDGSMRDADGNQVSWSEVMDPDLALEYDESLAAGTGAEGYETLEKFIGTSEGGKLRATLSDAAGAVGTVERVVDAFEGATDPQQITGTSGGFLGFANNMMNAVAGSAKNIKVFAQRDEKGNGIGESRTITEAADEFIDDSMVPEQFRGDAAMRTQYKSAMMQLLYADARLEEPGARQLSDADIQAAKDRLAFSSGDPRAVINTLGDVMKRRLEKTQMNFNHIKGMATARNLDPRRAVRRITGRDTDLFFEEQNARLDKIRTRGSEATKTKGNANVPMQNAPSYGAEGDALINEFLAP